MRPVFWFVFFALSCVSLQAQVLMEAKSVMRKDLPDGYPAQVFEKGFAIIRVSLKNETEEPYIVEEGQVTVENVKGKKIEKAEPEEITPEIMSFYTASGPGFHGERNTGYPGRVYGPRSYRTTTLDTGSPSRKVPATLGEQLRSQLEEYEFADGVVPPGEVMEGYLYVKSKKSGNALKGKVRLGALSADF